MIRMTPNAARNQPTLLMLFSQLKYGSTCIIWVHHRFYGSFAVSRVGLCIKGLLPQELFLSSDNQYFTKVRNLVNVQLS